MQGFPIPAGFAAMMGDGNAALINRKEYNLCDCDSLLCTIGQALREKVEIRVTPHALAPKDVLAGKVYVATNAENLHDGHPNVDTVFAAQVIDEDGAVLHTNVTLLAVDHLAPPPGVKLVITPELYQDLKDRLSAHFAAKREAAGVPAWEDQDKVQNVATDNQLERLAQLGKDWAKYGQKGRRFQIGDILQWREEYKPSRKRGAGPKDVRFIVLDNKIEGIVDQSYQEPADLLLGWIDFDGEVMIMKHNSVRFELAPN